MYLSILYGLYTIIVLQFILKPYEGTARKEVGRELGDTVPIIGFFNWQDLKNKENFLNGMESSTVGEVKLSSKSYQYVSSSQKMHQLEHNHSHFLLFDPGKSDKNAKKGFNFLHPISQGSDQKQGL